MTNLKKSAFRFVILIGVVSLFADMTYEGARSITGPYLAILGANAVVVGFVAGFGELIGYALRVVSGFIAERTGQYWVLTILGYICNLFAGFYIYCNYACYILFSILNKINGIPFIVE